MWTRVTGWAARLDASAAEQTTEQPVPTELTAALASGGATQATWESLDASERARLSSFVAAPWLLRNRRRHAKIVIRLCSSGPDEVRQWMSDNGGFSDSSMLGPPGWTG